MENQFQTLLSHFYNFAKLYLGLKKDATINFVSDPINSTDVLGKTAYYDPNAFSVTVYVDGRHPKDILRSISHELVHHRQNCQGKMDQPSSTEPGYAQNDPHLRGLEKEAYLVGNMCFRDWEDKYKANREVKTIYESTIRNFIKEKINMKSNDELRNIVKEAVAKVLNKRTLKEFDRYGDEFASDEDDAYFADLAKDFPGMGLDDKPAGAEPEAPADVMADMEDEFGSSEPEEEMDESMFTSQEDFFNNLQRYQDGKQDSVLPSAKDKDDDDEEEEKNEASTEKYDDAPELKGDQDELPDNLQKAIIDKEKGEEEKNEASMYPTDALIDILKTDPEFDLLASRADDVMANMRSGMTDEEALEAAYPDWVPGQLLRSALEKAKSGHSIPNRAIAEEEVVAEDFYTQLRKDARTISEDWNKDIRNKRSALLNERLMKAWKFTK